MPKLNQDKTFFFCGLATTSLGILMLGAALGIFWQSSDSVEQTHVSNVEKLFLDADTATRGKNMSMATGQIYGDVEGLFVLDHLTGSLSCIVLSPRNGVASLFFTNINRDLGAEKAGQSDFLLSTGYVNGNRGGRAGRSRNANCVIYVADGNTGKVAGYTLSFDQTKLDNGQGQEGLLTLVWAGASRENAIRRDQN